MAQISLHLNGEQQFGRNVNEGDCLNVSLHVTLNDICGSSTNDTFSRDCVFLHGSTADMRRFAEGILTAIEPPKVEPPKVEADAITQMGEH